MTSIYYTNKKTLTGATLRKRSQLVIIDRINHKRSGYSLQLLGKLVSITSMLVASDGNDKVF